ncbi:3'-5' exonuclease [Ochrovirga pacifica]|uniref:3'-5' exonuclease n=1 Tax=Ochrovirga pacifica TaxID=1042376 RepID=UPI0002EB464C|nr:3'-5' exonuclease [Ochrovirga pacifica]
MWKSIVKTFNYYLNRKNLPPFWKNYKETLKGIKKKDIQHSKFVVFDCETSGLTPKTDRILSMGAVTIVNNEIDIKNSFERYLEQDIYSRESAEIHGLLRNGKYTKHSEEEVIKDFLKYIEGAILVGHHVGFDVGCVNYALKRMGLPKLKNKTLDTGVLFKKTKHELYAELHNKIYSLDEVCDELNIQKKDRHTAYGDAFLTALVFFKILGKLNKNKDMRLKDLFYVPKIKY